MDINWLCSLSACQSGHVSMLCVGRGGETFGESVCVVVISNKKQ